MARAFKAIFATIILALSGAAPVIAGLAGLGHGVLLVVGAPGPALIAGGAGTRTNPPINGHRT
jgi:hypothetical protein